MPFKSKAQREKFEAMLKAKTISQETFDLMSKGTPTKLPERVGGKPGFVKVIK